ncbi:MAG: hypothetical protein R3E18_02820 [Sphingomonadaceae bacterium]
MSNAKLSPVIADPAKMAVDRILRREFEMAVSSRGSCEAFRQRLHSEMLNVLSDGLYNVVEPVASVAPGTGHLVARLRIGDGFYRALAAATEDGEVFITH